MPTKNDLMLMALAFGAVAFYAGYVYAKRGAQSAAPEVEMTAMDWFANHGGTW